MNHETAHLFIVEHMNKNIDKHVKYSHLDDVKIIINMNISGTYPIWKNYEMEYFWVGRIQRLMNIFASETLWMKISSWLIYIQISNIWIKPFWRYRDERSCFEMDVQTNGLIVPIQNFGASSSHYCWPPFLIFLEQKFACRQWYLFRDPDSSRNFEKAIGVILT